MFLFDTCNSIYNINHKERISTIHNMNNNNINNPHMNIIRYDTNNINNTHMNNTNNIDNPQYQ